MIFTNLDGQEFSENAMLAVLDRMGYGHVTVHGFRATFATWAEECTDYPDGVREAALAHKYKSETTAAYQRGQKLDKRRALMRDWAAFVSGSNIVPIALSREVVLMDWLNWWLLALVGLVDLLCCRAAGAAALLPAR